MRFFRLIILVITTFLLVACTDFMYTPEVSVPVITSLFAEPETNSVTLTSSLSHSNNVKVKCGFYLGKNNKTLTQYSANMSSNKEFKAVISDLEDGTTYWFKAYVTNGINEICTSLQTFETIKATTPEPPVTDPEKPNPPITEPDKPTPPEPEIPEPQPTFSAQVSGIQINTDSEIIEFIANISDDLHQVKTVWFMMGCNPNNLPVKITSTFDNGIMTGFTNKPEPGTYWIKAFISDGRQTKESELASFEIKAPPIPEPPVDPEPPTPEPPGPEQPDPGPEIPAPGPDTPDPETPKPPVEFTTEIGEITIAQANDIVQFEANIIGDSNLIKEGYFLLGLSDDKMIKCNGSINQDKMTGYTMGLPIGTYKLKAVISNLITVKESAVHTFTKTE